MADLKFDKSFDVRGKEFGGFVEDIGAHMAGCFGPDARFEDFVRMFDDEVNVFCRGGMTVCEDFSVRWIFDGDSGGILD